MIDTKRFREIKTLQDIRLEKAKLRYEMMLAENALSDNLNSLHNAFSFTAVVSRITEGYSFARNIFSRISGLYNWLFRRSKADI